MTCSNAVSSFFNLNNKNNIQFNNMINNYTVSNLPKNCYFEFFSDQKTLYGDFNRNYYPCSFPDSFRRSCWNPLAIKLLSSKDYLDSAFKNKILPSVEYKEASFRDILPDTFMSKIYGLDEISCSLEGQNLKQCTWIKTVNGKIGPTPSGNQLKYSIEKIGSDCTETLEFPISTLKDACSNNSSLLKCFQDKLSPDACKQLMTPKVESASTTAAKVITKTPVTVRSSTKTLTAIAAISGATFFGYKTVMEVDQLLNPYRFQYRDKPKASSFHAAVYGAASLACTYFAYTSLRL